MPLVSLFYDLQNKCLVRGFNNSIQASFPNCFQGDTLSLFMRFMNPTGNANTPYVDSDQSTSFVQAAIGTIGGVPSSGTFTITDPDGAQTTGAIAWNASAATVQAAIVAGLTTNWSTATVTGNAGGPWTITNGANAARSALTIQGGGLSPASQGTVEVQQAGSGSTPAIQYVKLQLSPIAYQDSWTAYPAPTITVANIQTGGVAGSNSIQSITLNNQPYNGTFTVSFGGQTTSPIPYNAAPSQVQTALQALSSIGSGNCTVGGSIGTYVVTFIGTLGGAAQAAFTTSAAGLVGPLALVGNFSLATVGIEEAIGEAQSILQTFEVNITPSGGSPQTILQTSVSIFNDLIPNAPANPTPTAVYLLSGNNLSDVASISTAAQNVLNGLSTTQGTIIYRGASSWAALAPGTSGTFLKTQGASANPVWAAAGAGGAIAWVTKTANYNLAAGDYIAADSTSGIFTLTLPSATGSGAEIDIIDPQASWATNNVTVAGTVNGATNLILNIAGGTVRLVDVGGGAGWRAN